MKSKIIPCIGCGREFPRKELNRNFRCFDCGMRMVGETMHQLMAHEGPLYEKWKAGVKAAAAKL